MKNEDNEDEENITVSITDTKISSFSNIDDAYLSLKNNQEQDNEQEQDKSIELQTMPLTDQDLKRMNEILGAEDTLYQNPISLTHPKKLGNTYAFCYIGNRPLIVIGPEYPYALSLFSVTISIFILVSLTILQNNFQIAKYIEIISFITHIISYTLTVAINPGIPSPDHYTKLNKQYKESNKEKKIAFKQPYIRCTKCNIIALRNEGMFHCKICNVCIQGHDHHCPWTGKCIGKYNFCFFGMFVISTVFFIFSSFFTFLLFISKNTKH